MYTCITICGLRDTGQSFAVVSWFCDKGLRTFVLGTAAITASFRILLSNPVYWEDHILQRIVFHFLLTRKPHRILTHKTLISAQLFVPERCYVVSILKVNRLVLDRLSCRSLVQCEETPTQYMTIHFQDRSGAASFRPKNCAEISVLCG